MIKKENKFQHDGGNSDAAGKTPVPMPFTRTNFILMGVCALLIIVGFLLMSGGGSADETAFNPEIFSTRRIVVGPAMAFLGFLFMAFAIIWKPRNKK